MAITKQQAQQELLRRQSVKVAPVKNTQQSTIQQAARAELARRELVKRGQMQQKPTGFKGLTQNFKTDFGSFAKGILGLGRQAITHPIKSSKVVGGLGKEIAKGIPGAVQSIGHDLANYGETQRKGIESFKQLRQIPLAQQKEMLAKDIELIGESKNGNEDQKRLAQVGAGLLGNYSQYSRFKEKVYNEPFSAILDALTVTKALGVNKLVGKGANAIGKTKYIAPVVEKVQDAFVPMGRLKRLGYGDVAEDIATTGANIRKSQAGIIKSTVKKFEKDFKLSKAEKVDFFETIDKGRRIPGYIAKSKNPKVQKAIDWYLNKELPKIQKGAGYTDGAPIENYLHHFFNPTKETKFGSKLSSPSRGYLKQSKDVEGFVKDPVVSIAGVKGKIATSNIKQGFIDRVIKKYGIDNATEFKNGKAFTEAGEEVSKYKGKYLPKDLADELTRIETGEHGWVKTILAPARAFNRNWKPLATAVRPRYHLRNIIGNVYNASFIGGAKGRRYFQAASQQMKGYIANQMKEGTIAGKVFKAFYKNPPEHKYIKMAIDDDVIGRGFFSVDINDMADVADKVEDYSKLIAKMDKPAMVYKIPVLRQWMQVMQKFGSTIEDNARLSLYIDQLKRGASRAAAKTYVNKHLFDYLNGLGDADKVIKAVIPFWSWTRFNIPLQFGAIAKNPLRHLVAQEFGKPYVQQNEANNPEYKYLSQTEKDMGAIKTGETTKNGKVYDKYMRTQNVLPLQDLMRVPGILSGQQDDLGLSPVFDMVSQARNMVSPPKNPQENLDYYGRPVESFPGEVKRYFNPIGFLTGNKTTPVRGTGKEILQSIPLLSELNKLFGGSYDDKSRPTLSSRLETVFSPTSSTLVDREKNRQYFESDFNRTFGTGTMQPGYLTELKYAAKSVIENPKDAVSVKNFRTLINLMKEGGMTDAQIKQEIEKAVQAQLKKESPKPKKPSSLRPQKPSPLLDPYYAEEVKKRAANLNPYFSN
jgi:hypothetical protein